MGSEKKPLNPFLGELFVGKWADNTPDQRLGETVLVSEQVSHHPPQTGYAIFNDKNKTTLQGYNAIKASFSGISMSVKQFGHAILTYENLNEQYLITLPPLHIEGIAVASPFVELDGKSYIQSSSGYITVIDYSGRGYFSGKKNSFKARIYRDNGLTKKKENALYTISGQWSKISKITPPAYTPLMKVKARSSTAEEIFFDSQKAVPQHLIVKPIEEQNDLESRKAWKEVAEAIKVGDYDSIHQAKSKIEEEQRSLRKKEGENKQPWKTRFFVKDTTESSDPASLSFIKLSNLAGLSTSNVPSGTLTGSSKEKPSSSVSNHWRFNRKHWDNETVIKI